MDNYATTFDVAIVGCTAAGDERLLRNGIHPVQFDAIYLGYLPRDCADVDGAM